MNKNSSSIRGSLTLQPASSAESNIRDTIIEGRRKKKLSFDSFIEDSQRFEHSDKYLSGIAKFESPEAIARGENFTSTKPPRDFYHAERSFD